ncbi:MAG: hypothetical protein O2894_11545, partial [Planctomycetota bacterium]|nr:hypothetical protein [Planctomycetota bacterium]
MVHEYRSNGTIGVPGALRGGLARGLLLALLLGLAGLGSARVGSAEDEDVRARVAAWIVDLRSDDFGTREAARTGLNENGLAARDLLEAARDDEDPEVRRTLRAILERVPPPVTTPPDRVAPGDFRTLGSVTLQAKEQPLHEVLARLAQGVGAHLTAPEALRTAPTSVDLEGVPFYAALDQILGPHGLHFDEPFDALGVGRAVVRPTGVEPAPWSASGPMRLRVTDVATSRTLGSVAPVKHALTLELSWPPSVQLAQVESPTIEVARDPDGKPYQPTPAMNRQVTYGVGSNQLSHTLTVHLMPGQADCAPKLGALELGLMLLLRFDPVRVDFDAGQPLPQTRDGVTLHAIEEVEGAAGQYVVDFSAELPEGAAERSLSAQVIEQDGSPSHLGVYGGRSRSGDGTVRIRARAYRGSRGAPPAIRIGWHRREERGSLRFRLESIPL